MDIKTVDNDKLEGEKTQRIQAIIVQAGGKGSRMGNYTANKPKALISVDGLPMLWHLFKIFPDKGFIIIGDYKYDVLSRYVENFYDGKYILVKSDGIGTCAGLKEALSYIKEDEPFMLIWSDILLPSNFSLDNIDSGKNYIGISKNFECRWSYVEGVFKEEKSNEHGVAGLFIFNSKNVIDDVPTEGEFVRYLSTKKGIKFVELPLWGAREIGSKKSYERYESSRSQTRPFNQLLIDNDKVIKKPLDAQGERLAKLESNWYEFVKKYKFDYVPEIFSFNPLVMERIYGKHPFDYVSYEEKRKVLLRILDGLETLHKLVPPISGDVFSCKREYIDKTFDRLKKVRDIIPLAEKKEFKVNGRLYKNPLFYREELENIAKTFYEKEFHVIHGDITFSNILVSDEFNPKFIDPRGYFGFTKIFGDKDYDYAKLYYSIYGNYDKFNRRRFFVNVYSNDVTLEIESNGWEDFRSYFFENVGKEKIDKIEFLHAVIWLSLTSYAWDDYDSIIGAFYRGVEMMGRFL